MAKSTAYYDTEYALCECTLDGISCFPQMSELQFFVLILYPVFALFILS